MITALEGCEIVIVSHQNTSFSHGESQLRFIRGRSQAHLNRRRHIDAVLAQPFRDARADLLVKMKANGRHDRESTGVQFCLKSRRTYRNRLIPRPFIFDLVIDGRAMVVVVGQRAMNLSK